MWRLVVGSIVLFAAALSRPVTALAAECELTDAAVARGGVLHDQSSEQRDPSQPLRESLAHPLSWDSTTQLSLMNGLRLADVSAVINDPLVLDSRLGQALGRRVDGLLPAATRGLQASDSGRYGLTQRHSAPLLRDTGGPAFGNRWAGMYHRLVLGGMTRPSADSEPGPLAALIAGLCGIYAVARRRISSIR